MALLMSRPRLIAGATLLMIACGDVNETEPTEASQLRSADQALGNIVDEPPRPAVERGGLLPQRTGPFVDWQGRKWNCTHQARQVVVDQAPHFLPSADVKDEIAPKPTVEQLAESMRPVTLLNGFECIGEADYETARKIVEGTDGAKVTDGSEKIDKAGCCGNDDRNIEGWNFVFDKLILSEVGCTASFIHPSVAITAAHCLYDTVSNAFLTVPNGSGGTWLPDYRDGVQGGTIPQPRPTLDCYVISINAGYVNSTTNFVPQHDYAYIDFSTSPGGPCPNPAPSVSWFGTNPGSDAYIEAGTHRSGYPADVNTAHGPITGTTTSPVTHQYTYNTWPRTVNGRPWQVGGTPDAISYEIRSTIDMSSGDSGSPLWANSDFRVVGTTVGTYGTGTNPNVHRRWDSTYYWYVVNNTPF